MPASSITTRVDGGCGSGGGEPNYGAAALPPHCGEGPHGGCFAGACRRDRKLQPGTRGGHVPNECDLSGVEEYAIGGRFQQRHIHCGCGDGGSVATPCGGNEPLLGVQ